ncbi:hypothetical protein SAMN05216388_1003183 [Halorientalis persicus]|uniref:DUF2178 domain-containing protein n=1 Tax=Halorientalis persicus TaxID=1367881 RepID=A0A1H8GT37_9EURY|nr:hypothetical protein [Halorientalis persicus]SEN46657.1 hypothetical protein SAMN05216388_1003183 [Halorientalis persicus]
MTGVFERAGRIRSAVAGLAAVSGLGLAAFTVLNRPFVAVGVYAVALAGAVGLQATAEVPVFDERDEAISRDAANWTLAIFGWASAGVFPALTVAWGLGIFEWPLWSVAIALFVAVLYLTYGALAFALGRKRSA